MKFIHCSDLHLDSKIDSLPTEKTKIRREEILTTFERLCAYANDNDVKAVIIAGDMFDTDKISQKTRNRVLETVGAYPSVDFLYLSGNHDEENLLFSCENIPNNLKKFGKDWTSYNYGNTVISGVVTDNVNKKVVYDTLSLNKDNFNIVVLHGQIAGYKNDTDAETVSLPLLKDKNIDYLALGHIHSVSEGKLDSRGIYAYSGCLDGRGFDETGDKGFFLLDVNDKKADRKFVKFSSKNFYCEEFDVSGFSVLMEIKNALISSLMEKYDKNSLLKVVLKGEHSANLLLDVDYLSAKLNERFFFAKVYDKTELKISIEDYALDKSLRGEFVRTVWESDLEESVKKQVIMRGINALKGEEI